MSDIGTRHPRSSRVLLTNIVVSYRNTHSQSPLAKSTAVPPHLKTTHKFTIIIPLCYRHLFRPRIKQWRVRRIMAWGSRKLSNLQQYYLFFQFVKYYVHNLLVRYLINQSAVSWIVYYINMSVLVYMQWLHASPLLDLSCPTLQTSSVILLSSMMVHQV